MKGIFSLGKDFWHTAATYSTLLTLTPSLGPLASILSAAEETRSDPLLHLWAEGVLRAASVVQDVGGLENIPAGPCVYVANHQSHFDAPMLFAHLPGHVRFVAKASLFQIPFFGQALKNTGFVKVDRSGGTHDRQVLAEAVHAVRNRTSLLFFAEGTRSDDGVLKPFKKGAAVLALQAQVPMVPVAVAGTRSILKKGSALVHGGRKVVMRVGKPLSTAGLDESARGELTEKLQDAVKALLDEAEASLQAGR